MFTMAQAGILLTLAGFILVIGFLAVAYLAVSLKQ